MLNYKTIGKLKEVLFWTNGQPFLTQKICSLTRNSSNAITQKVAQVWIENLVRKNIIENWEAQDEPEHLRTIRDRKKYVDELIVV